MPKETIFISHATHEDDYCAGWLASKLTYLGYNVFIDLEDLRVGDAFYTVIQPVIQQESVRFIAINTKNYIRKAAEYNSGVRKEINAATTVMGDKNFVVPVRFDDVSYSDFPMDYTGRNCIDFHNRWGDGLKELVQELEKLGTPKTNKNNNPLALWHTAINSRNHHFEGEEKVYSNWFKIHLPDHIYIHLPDILDKQLLWNIPSAVVLESNRIISFADTDTVSKVYHLRSTIRVKTTDFLVNEELKIDEEFTLIRPYDKLKQLLNKAFKGHCRSRGLKKYYQAGDKEVYYFRFTKDEAKPISVSLKKYGKSRTQLNGNKWGKNWHFALSARTELKPFPHYQLSYHIIFSDDLANPIMDTAEQHALRRKFSSILYNKKTLEMLLASMLFLSQGRDSEQLKIQVADDAFMTVDNEPLSFTLNHSYIEPNADI